MNQQQVNVVRFQLRHGILDLPDDHTPMIMVWTRSGIVKIVLHRHSVVKLVSDLGCDENILPGELAAAENLVQLLPYAAFIGIGMGRIYQCAAASQSLKHGGSDLLASHRIGSLPYDRHFNPVVKFDGRYHDSQLFSERSFHRLEEGVVEEGEGDGADAFDLDHDAAVAAHAAHVAFGTFEHAFDHAHALALPVGGGCVGRKVHEVGVAGGTHEYEHAHLPLGDHLRFAALGVAVHEETAPAMIGGGTMFEFHDLVAGSAHKEKARYGRARHPAAGSVDAHRHRGIDIVAFGGKFITRVKNFVIAHAQSKPSKRIIAWRRLHLNFQMSG